MTRLLRPRFSAIRYQYDVKLASVRVGRVDKKRTHLVQK
eukprot:COSAG02_NODE_280_length_25797_cov_66.644447_19_plen_39_part_00